MARVTLQLNFEADLGDTADIVENVLGALFDHCVFDHRVRDISHTTTVTSKGVAFETKENR